MARDLLAEQAALPTQEAQQTQQVQPSRNLLAEAAAREDAPSLIGGVLPGELINRLSEIRRKGLLPTLKETGVQAAAVPLGAAQEAERITRGIPGRGLGILGLLGEAFKGVGADRLPSAIRQIPSEAPQEAGVGAALTDIGATTAATLPLAALGGVPGAIAGQALGGSLISPQHRALGGIIGAGLGTAGEAAEPLVTRAIPALARAINPQRISKDILDKLSGGRSLEENAKSLALDVKNQSEKVKGDGGELFNNVLDLVGDNPVVDGGIIAGSKTRGIPIPSEYNLIDKDIPQSFNRKLKRLNDKFNNNPTFDNAHQLQSQLGTEVRSLKKVDKVGKLSIADRNTLIGYDEAHQALLNDMHESLNIQNPELASQYNNARENWLTNAVPYTETPKIAEISTGKITNPKNIISVFKNPEPGIQKIVNDLGDNAKNKILYGDLGKIHKTVTAEKLIKATGDLDKKGLESYMTDDFADQINSLHKRTQLTKGLQTGAGLLAGLAIGRPFGVGAEAAGALGGAAVSPILMRTIADLTRLPTLTKGILEPTVRGLASRRVRSLLLPAIIRSQLRTTEGGQSQ